MLETDIIDQQTPPFLIAVVGFTDAQEQERIITLFKRAALWEQPWMVVDSQDAQVLLLPADTPDEQSRWHDYSQQFKKLGLIAYAKQPFSAAQWHLHRKPGVLPAPLEFTILLKRIGEFIAHAKDREKIAETAKDQNPLFDYATNFAGLLHDLSQEKAYAEICAFDLPPLLIAAPERHYAIGQQARLQDLHALFELHREHVTVNRLDAETFQARLNEQDLLRQPWEQLLWYTAICSSGGRLPKGHEAADVTVTLKVWPPYAIDLPLFSEYLPIAAVLHRRTLTFEQVAQLTGGSLEQIADFCNACNLLGLVEWEAKTYIPHPGERTIDGTLLKSISRRFKAMRQAL